MDEDEDDDDDEREYHIDSANAATQANQRVASLPFSLASTEHNIKTREKQEQHEKHSCPPVWHGCLGVGVCELSKKVRPTLVSFTCHHGGSFRDCSWNTFPNS